jgi:hypothetical protein
MRSQRHFEMQRHFEIRNVALREAVQIPTLIADLDGIVRILNRDIAAEEERARVYNQSDANYPILARTLTARRDNLRGTIAALEQRLATTTLFEPAA